MRRLVRVVVLAMALAALAGCGRQRAMRTQFPWLFGMQRVSAQLWVEPGMPDSTRFALLRDLGLARLRLQRWYGPLLARPTVLACAGEPFARSMGLHDARAFTFGGRAILLGPRDLTERALVHEGSHAELDRRLRDIGGPGIRRVPRWFDEGLASAISEDTARAEAHWRRYQELGLATPSLNELMSMRQFAEARAKYDGVRVDTMAHVSLVYATSAHEVLGWLHRAGPLAPARLVAALGAGEPFGQAYLRLEGGGPDP